jgi:outer membrane protein insertion porin family
MRRARGWPQRYDGQARWSNWFELRTPIAENVVWFDQFFDAAGLWREREDFTQLGIEDMLFSFGAGFRFTIPQFPIRLYLAKRFRVNQEGGVEWQTGSIFNPEEAEGRGLDFVLSFSTDFLGGN